MKNTLLILISLLILSKQESLGSQKSAQLRQLALKSQNNFISLNNEEFNYFVNEHPRPYDIVAFYASEQLDFSKNIEIEFHKIIQIFKNANLFYPQMKDKKPAIYFVKLEFSQTTKLLFQDMGFQTVPNLVITSSKTVQMKNPDDRKIHLRDNTWQFAPSDGVITVQKILDFINKKTQRNVQYQESIFNLLIVLGFLGMFLFLLKLLWQLFKPFLLKPNTQFTVSIIFYNLFLGGLTHTILNNTPWYQMGHRGQIEWFSKQQRQQYGLEGIILSFLMILIALIFVFYIRLIKNFEIGRMQKNLFGSIAFYLIIYLLQTIQDLFRQKQWYNPIFWPPQEYVKGSLSRDQGVSF